MKLVARSRLLNTWVPALAVATLVAAAPVMADEEKLTIRYKAYQLDSQAGAEDVYAQIENAVKDYCVSHGVRPVQQHRDERACVAEMLDEAISKVSNRRLTRIHQGELAPRVAP